MWKVLFALREWTALIKMRHAGLVEERAERHSPFPEDSIVAIFLRELKILSISDICRVSQSDNNVVTVRVTMRQVILKVAHMQPLLSEMFTFCFV